MLYYVYIYLNLNKKNICFLINYRLMSVVAYNSGHLQNTDHPCTK